MTHTATTTTIHHLMRLLALGALAVAVALALATPAAAFVVDEDDEATGDATVEQQAETDDRDVQGDDHDTAPPVGGVDAGLGGGATDPGGLGAPHAAAAALLGLALAGHAANARRAGTVRG